MPRHTEDVSAAQDENTNKNIWMCLNIYVVFIVTLTVNRFKFHHTSQSKGSSFRFNRFGSFTLLSIDVNVCLALLYFNIFLELL